MQLYTVDYIWNFLYMFRVIPPPIIRSPNNCIDSIWYLSHRYCYLPLSWKGWNWFECAVGSVRHPQHTQTSSNSSTIAADGSNGATNTRCCLYSCMGSWWWVVSPETCRAVSRYNKLCNVASCWIYTGIFLWCTDPWTLKQLNYYVKHLAHFVPITVTQIYGGNWILTERDIWSSDSPKVPFWGYLRLESVSLQTRMAKIDCGESSLASIVAIKLSVVTCRLYSVN